MANPCGHLESYRVAVAFDEKDMLWMKQFEVCVTCDATWSDGINVLYEKDDPGAPAVMERSARIWADVYVPAKGPAMWFD